MQTQDLIDLLRSQAREIERAGHAGWGNTMTTAADMLQFQREALKTELQAWRDGGLTEEILRRNDGTIKVGSGCRFVYEQYITDTEVEISALKAKVAELEAQHKDCLEQKEALREKVERIELKANSAQEAHCYGRGLTGDPE